MMKATTFHRCFSSLFIGINICLALITPVPTWSQEPKLRIVEHPADVELALTRVNRQFLENGFPMEMRIVSVEGSYELLSILRGIILDEFTSSSDFRIMDMTQYLTHEMQEQFDNRLLEIFPEDQAKYDTNRSLLYEAFQEPLVREHYIEYPNYCHSEEFEVIGIMKPIPCDGGDTCETELPIFYEEIKPCRIISPDYSYSSGFSDIQSEIMNIVDEINQ